VRGIFAAAETVDPGFRDASSIWARGKTARLEMAIPGVGPLPVHLMVEDSDPRLLRALYSRLKSGQLEWVDGRAAAVDGVVPAVSALLGAGIGVLVVREMLGELILSLTGKPSIPYPMGLEPGRPSPLPRPEAEGFRALLFEGRLILVGGFHGLRREEVKAAKRAPITLGLAPVTPDLLSIGMKYPNLMSGWTDMPFAIGVEKPETRKWLPPGSDGTTVVIVAVVDCLTNVAAAVRVLWMSPSWTAGLHDIVDRQIDRAGGYDRARYVAEVDVCRAKYPTPNDLRPLMTRVETAQDITEFSR
jgi:hypothetical protein